MKGLFILSDVSQEVVIQLQYIAAVKAIKKINVTVLAHRKDERLIGLTQVAETILIHEAQSYISLNKKLRGEHYDEVYDLSGKGRNGILAVLSRGKYVAGISGSPVSILFKKRIQLNSEEALLYQLCRLSMEDITLARGAAMIQLDNVNVEEYITGTPYFCIYPFLDVPVRKPELNFWKDLVRRLPSKYMVYIMGEKGDAAVAEEFISLHPNVRNLTDKISLEQALALGKGSFRCFTNQNIYLQLLSTAGVMVTACIPASLEAKSLTPRSFIRKKISIAGLQADEVITAFDAAEYQEAIEDNYSAEEKLSTALYYIKQGGVIVQNTDTIPGLSANAINKNAISRIHAIKERDPSKSLLILCSSMRMVKNYVTKVPELVFEILDKAGEVPVTIIYPFAKNLPDDLIAKDGSIGIRIPTSQLLRQMIANLGFPILSTSANFSGDPAPAHLKDLDPEIVKKVDLILDIPMMDNEYKKASTIIKIEENGLKMIREGALNKELIDLINNSQ